MKARSERLKTGEAPTTEKHKVYTQQTPGRAVKVQYIQYIPKYNFDNGGEMLKGSVLIQRYS